MLGIISIVLSTVVAGDYNPPDYDNITLVLDGSYTSPDYDNITLVLGEITPTDSCTPPSINNDWNVDWNDNCTLNSNTDLGTGSLIITGNCSGSFTLNANLTVKNKEFIPSGTGCKFIRLPNTQFVRTG